MDAQEFVTCRCGRRFTAWKEFADQAWHAPDCTAIAEIEAALMDRPMPDAMTVGDMLKALKEAEEMRPVVTRQQSP